MQIKKKAIFARKLQDILVVHKLMPQSTCPSLLIIHLRRRRRRRLIQSVVGRSQGPCL